MKDELKQLVYTSVEARELSKSEIKEILASSRKNNAEKGITGLLLYRNHTFIQALEGEEQNVTDIFNAIKADKRHTEVATLWFESISNRHFPNWAMAFNNQDNEELEGLSDFLHPFKSKDELDISTGAVKTLLKRFRQVNQRQ